MTLRSQSGGNFDNVRRFPTDHSGGGGGSGMDDRIGRLEGELSGFKETVSSRFDAVDRRLEGIERALLTKWDVAVVVAAVTTALMAAALFLPRLVALIDSI